jgi:hypothetical protein
MAVLMVAAFSGVLLIVQQRGGGATPGIALTFAGVACCALYTVLCRRLLLADATLPVVLAQQLAALGFAVVLAAAFAASGHLTLPTGVPARSWLTAMGPASPTTPSRSGSTATVFAAFPPPSPAASSTSSPSSASPPDTSCSTNDSPHANWPAPPSC